MAFRAARTLFSKTSGPVHAAAKKAPSPFVKNWLSDSATYPIMLVIGVAGSLVVFQMQRIAFNHPDVNWAKDDRSSYIRDNDDDAESHYEHPIRSYARKNDTQIMSKINNAMVNNKVRE